MKVSEIFYSLQGEGFLAGTPSVFVRLAGCPLRCRWCDTKYAQPPQSGNEYSVEQILEETKKWSCRHAVVTGGEPMINPDLADLAQRLQETKKHITIETAGVSFVPGLVCDLMSISPKLSNSIPESADLAAIHKKAMLNFPVLRELIKDYNYQMKFVVDSADDLAEIRATIEEIGNVDTEKVLLMAQAATRDKFMVKFPMVAEMCKQAGFAFSPRLQVLLWNNQRGT